MSHTQTKNITLLPTYCYVELKVCFNGLVSDGSIMPGYKRINISCFFTVFS